MDSFLRESRRVGSLDRLNAVVTGALRRMLEGDDRTV